MVSDPSHYKVVRASDAIPNPRSTIPNPGSAVPNVLQQINGFNRLDILVWLYMPGSASNNQLLINIHFVQSI